MRTRTLFLALLLLIPLLTVSQPAGAQPTVLLTFHTSPAASDFMIIFDGGAYTDGMSAPFEPNLPHNATAKPGNGYYFDRWTNSSGVIVEDPKNPNTRVTLTGSPSTVDLTANFVPNEIRNVQCGGSNCSVTSNSTITGTSYNPSTGNMTITFSGPSGISGFANVTVPKSLVQNQDASNIRVYLNGTQIPSPQVVISMNSTHFFIYFTFTFQSVQQASIIFLPVSQGIGPYLVLSALLLIIPLVLAIRTRTQRRLNS